MNLGIKELENRVWYRLLKVFGIVIIIFASLFSVIYSFIENLPYNQKTSEIICNLDDNWDTIERSYGSSFKSLEACDEVDSNNIFSDTIRKNCIKEAEKSVALKENCQNKESTQYAYIFIVRGSYYYAILLSLLLLVIIPIISFVIFSIMLRIIVYIMYGGRDKINKEKR